MRIAAIIYIMVGIGTFAGHITGFSKACDGEIANFSDPSLRIPLWPMFLAFENESGGKVWKCEKFNNGASSDQATDEIQSMQEVQGTGPRP